MKLKRMLAPLVAVVAVAAAFAAPAAAQAALHFTDNGNPITGAPFPTLHYTGEAEFVSEAGGVKCEHVTALVEFTTTEAHVRAFDPTNVEPNCETTGLLPLFGCELANATAPESQEFPWTIDPVSLETGTVTQTKIDIPLRPGCGLGIEEIVFEATP